MESLGGSLENVVEVEGCGVDHADHHAIASLPRRSLIAQMKTLRWWADLALGQLISLLLTGMGITSQLLSSRYAFDEPVAQSFLNYASLVCIYAPAWIAIASSSVYIADTRRFSPLPTASVPIHSNPSSSSSSSSDALSADEASGRIRPPLLDDDADTRRLVLPEPHSSVASSTVVDFSYKRGADCITERLREAWWKYLLVALCDVEANYLVVLAYQYTSITSIQLLDGTTVIWVALLSYFFLRVRYSRRHLFGILVCLTGFVVFVIADLHDNSNNNVNVVGGSSSSRVAIGDMLCLAGAALYATSNVAQEYFIKTRSRIEFLAMIGLFGTAISVVQMYALEYASLAQVIWSWQSSKRERLRESQNI